MTRQAALRVRYAHKGTHRAARSNRRDRARLVSMLWTFAFAGAL